MNPPTLFQKMRNNRMEASLREKRLIDREMEQLEEEMRKSDDAWRAMQANRVFYGDNRTFGYFGNAGGQ